MTRTEIIDFFRQECPEITERVITDTTLNAWCIIGNMESAIKGRLIKGEGAFNSVVGVSQYNLTSEISNFYDMDDMPGGGVYYDAEPIDLTSKSALNNSNSTWKSNSNGIPEEYFRRNNFLVLDRPASAIVEIIVDCVLYPDSFDSGEKIPFNELTHLTPFHYAIVLYLIMRAKSKVGKPEESMAAKQEYNEYIEWMKKEVNRGTLRTIQYNPKKMYS